MALADIDKYIGCFLGLAIGDAFGAGYEGGILERLLWRAIGRTRSGRLRYTDDTQMSIDLASSFIEKRGIDQEHLAKTFASGYRWSRGYGPSAGKLLKKIRSGSHWSEVNRQRFKDGSLGNGAAMRAPVLAMCYPKDELKLRENVEKASIITHAHPLAIEGAWLIGFTTRLVLNGATPEAVLELLSAQSLDEKYREKVILCSSYLEKNRIMQLKDVKNNLGNGITATESCVTAIYFALKYFSKSLDEMLQDIAAIGGDVDTIGAMAGAIWGAANGYQALKTKERDVENSEAIIDLAKKLCEISRL